jgi:hypothetical protein
MATIYADPDIPASGPLGDGRRLDECLRALEACGRERLAPLAQHMAQKRLVRARGDVGAPLRHLDIHTLREALRRMLRQDDDAGYLIVRLVVEGAEPDQVAAEQGVSRAVLVERLRHAVDELAIEYEDVAYASVGECKQEWVLATPATGTRSGGQQPNRRRAPLPPVAL